MGHTQMPFSALSLPHLQLQSFEEPCARSAQCSSGCSGDRSTSGLSVFSALCWRGGEVRHGHRPLLLLARKPGSSAQFNARLRLSTYAMDLTLLHRSRMRDWALGPVISLVNGITQRVWTLVISPSRGPKNSQRRHEKQAKFCALHRASSFMQITLLGRTSRGAVLCAVSLGS